MSVRPKGPLYVDACAVWGNWDTDRSVLESVRRGGITAFNAHFVNWHNFDSTMTEIARYKRWVSENPDLIIQAYSVDDIERAYETDRLALVIGFQNTSAIDEKIYFLRLFGELGVRVVQLTYSTASAVGGGCFESHDLPLTDFGHEVLAELNELGMLVDLSHCGPQTTADAIRASTQPVSFTHVTPAALRSHPRNKTDTEIRAVADKGGVIGITLEPSFLKAGPAATIDDYLEAIEYTINVAGEEHVGVGTDFGLGRKPTDRGPADRERGYGRFYLPAEFDNQDINPEIPAPAGLRDIETQRADLISGMEKRHWREERVTNVLGQNWLKLFRTVWH